ncbi:MAG TPA: class I SAM-dependent methyltransferase [Thermoleophilaceae bacterium]
MATEQIDTTRAEEFAGQMIGILNGGMTSLLVSIGHRLGLFDSLAELPPSTSAEIAEATGLDERYIREWANGLTVAGVLVHDSESNTYALPPEHAAAITRAAGPDNVATLAQYVGLLAEVEEPVIQCFRNGGGVPYSAYPRFQALQAEETAQVYDAALVHGVVPLVPGLTERLEQGIDAIDVGCGQGHAVNVLARAFPNSRFTGRDISEEGIAAGREEANALGLTNARFEQASVTDIEGEYDLITAFDVIHDLADPAGALAAISRSLKPGGTYLMVDIAGSSDVDRNADHPLGPALYTVSLMHCMTVSLAQHGAGLGTMWGEELAQQMLADAGFAKVSVQRVDGDFFNVYYVCSKD